MNRIRVLIANHPRLMRELISTTMADQPDIELVGEVGKQQDLAEAVAETRPDVLIIPMDDEKEYREQGGFLLGRYPEMKIIALAPEQNRALLYWAIIDIRSKSPGHSRRRKSLQCMEGRFVLRKECCRPSLYGIERSVWDRALRRVGTDEPMWKTAGISS